MSVIYSPSLQESARTQTVPTYYAVYAARAHSNSGIKNSYSLFTSDTRKNFPECKNSNPNSLKIQFSLFLFLNGSQVNTQISLIIVWTLVICIDLRPNDWSKICSTRAITNASLCSLPLSVFIFADVISNGISTIFIIQNDTKFSVVGRKN